jgi:hypothetical protein
MGIYKDGIRLLMREGSRKKFSGRVLQLGRQEVLSTERNMKKISEEENFKLSEPREDIGYGKSKFSDEITVNDRYFFQSLGFEVVDSLDISTFEGANIIHDLNKLLTKELMNISTYDLIYDGGTMEHIFHIPNILKNIFDLLSVDGRIIHANPINMFNHGLYNFSTCFYEDFYSANGFLINECGVIKIPNVSWSGNRYYTSGHKNSQFIRSLNPGLLDGANYMTNFIATKLHDSTGHRVPQQGIYSMALNPSDTMEEQGNLGLVDGNSSLKFIYNKLLAVPILKPFIKYLRGKYADFLVKWEVI